MCDTGCGCQEFGKCDICGKENFLERTYFHYNIPCECCGDKEDGKDMHFELVCHCENCIPDIPRYITPLLKDNIGNGTYRIKIEGMLPYKIDRQFCIQHNCCEKHIKDKTIND